MTKKEFEIQVAENMRRARISRGLTLKALGELIGKDYTALANYENAKTGFGAYTLFKIESVLGPLRPEHQQVIPIGFFRGKPHRRRHVLGIFDE